MCVGWAGNIFFYVFIAVKLLLLCLFREVNMVLDEQWNKENERKR